MAVTAIKDDLRNELLRILKEDINYQVQDGDGGNNLVPDAIVYRPTKAKQSRSFEVSQQLMDMPGIIVTEPSSTLVERENGTVNQDLWHYFWLLQLVDKDLWESPGRIATWQKWTEQIISILNFSGLNGVVMYPKGEIWWCNATQADDIDEKSWIKDGNFISGIELEIKVLQPRG